MTELTLDKLALLFAVCQTRATPHREPDFRKIRQLAIDGGSTVVKGIHILTEEHNTGYDGVLYRYIMTVKNVDGKTTSFQIDLLPDQITLGGEDGPEAA